MITVYQTDDEGYLIGAVEADPDPLTPGNWLIPRGCVTQQPPAAAANQIARWSNGAWEIVPDFRGRAYWLPSGERHEITERGIALPPRGIGRTARSSARHPHPSHHAPGSPRSVGCRPAAIG